MAVAVAAAVMPAVALLIAVAVRRKAIAGHWDYRRGDSNFLGFFTQAYRAALFVLTITVGAVFVTGKGGALDTAAHLTSMFVPHISIRAGLHAGQRSALGHWDAAFTHLTAKVVPLISRRALKGAVCSYVGTGVIVETLAKQTSVFVCQETIGTFVAGQSAVLQRWTQQRAYRFIRRLFTEWAALSGDLYWVLAALFAGHGRTVWVSIHTLAEGAVILFPLFLVSSQLIVHPAARHSAIHRQ